MTIKLQRRLFNVDEYHLMAEVGIFREDDRVELLKGEVIDKERVERGHALDDVTYRFNIHDYYRMAEAGILAEDDRVELIEGDIIQMAPIGSRHASTVNRLTALLSHLIPQNEAIVSVQNPIRTTARSQPQPDVCLLRSRDDFYADVHPHPEDVFLVVEVAESSLGYDRLVKLPLYAAAGIPEVWIIDLESKKVEMYRSPSGSAYEVAFVLGPGETIRPEAFPATFIATSEILG